METAEEAVQSYQFGIEIWAAHSRPSILQSVQSYQFGIEILKEKERVEKEQAFNRTSLELK